MILRPLLALAAAASLAACDMAATGDPAASSAAIDVPEVAAGELSEATMKAVIERLASDEFEGRAPGTPGEEKTVAYLIEQFEKAGLKPGNNGSWVQKVPLVEITGSDHAPLAIEGKDGKSLSFAYGSDWVGATYRETRARRPADSELVFVGYGIVAPEKGWNDYAGLDMKGKTAVILINDPDYEAKELGGRVQRPGDDLLRPLDLQVRGSRQAGRRCRDHRPRHLPRRLRLERGRKQLVGSASLCPARRQGRQPDANERLGAESRCREDPPAGGQDLAKLSAAAKKKGFKPVPLGVTASTGFSNAIRTFESQNVIGLLEGREAKDEYVLYTAHWDHLGRCKPDASGDDICNGAVDNATGTAALVALAEANAKAGPARRSQVFLAVTAEESGLLGSEYYARQSGFPARADGRRHQHGRHADGGRSKDVIAIGGGKSELDAFLDMGREGRAGRVATPRTDPEKGYYYRSDHFSLAKVGVPMLYVEGGEDFEQRRPGGRRGVGQEQWTEQIYHQPSDEFDPAWDWAGAMQILRLYYRIGRSWRWPRMAELERRRRIPRDPRQELRAGGRLLRRMTRSACRPNGRRRTGCGSAFRTWPTSGRAISCRAQEQIAAFANAVAESGQAVRLLVRDAANEARARAAGDRPRSRSSGAPMATSGCATPARWCAATARRAARASASTAGAAST